MDDLLHAIDSPRRRAILRFVWEEERTAGDIHRAVGEVTFGAISQHLKVLTDAGLTAVRREGRKRYYIARREHLGPLAGWLESMWDEALSGLQRLAESDERTSKKKKKRASR